MRIMRTHFMLLLFLAFSVKVFAGIVPIEDARLIAKNLYYERVQAFKDLKPDMVKITEEFTVTTGGVPVYYAFNIGQNEGFVMVSAEDLVYPVLGYAFEGSFRTDNHHPSFRAQMQLYEDQIVHARELKVLRLTEIEDVWEKYRKQAFSPAKDLQTVGPICKTKWDQDGYYNDSCPNNSVTGCVATAMAQVMKAFNWPPKGKGSYSYTHPYYGVQYANFGNTSYKWSAMPNEVTTPNASVAQLMYHSGVSVDMSYSPGGSGANMGRAKDAFFLYFRYSGFIRFVQKSGYSDIYWKILIRAQHMEGRPVMYSGPGHAFVCDGFQYPDHFHFNWGWGGSYDGYFYMTSLRPGSYNFTNGQDAIVDAYPDSTAKMDVIGEGGMRLLMEGEEVQINPNPATDGKIKLVLMNDYTGEVRVTISDLAGKQHERLVLEKSTEWSLSDLNLRHLGKGFFVMQVTMGSQTLTRKFILQ